MDLSILKHCPHCDAPMTPTSYNFCIGENGKCTCCNSSLPKNHSFEKLECSVCAKPLTAEDFENNAATYTQDQLICLDCISAKRVLQKDKEIYNCDFCGVELTQLDFLEDNADIKRMLIVCKSCLTKHFKDEKSEPEKKEKTKNKEKKTKKPKKKKDQIVSETAQSLMKAVQSTVQELEESEKQTNVKEDEKANSDTAEIVENAEKTDEKKGLQHSTLVSKITDRGKQSAQNFDFRAALGCLVVLVIALSAGIAYLVYDKYAEDKSKTEEDLAFIISAVRDRQNDLAASLERFGNRLYYLEQLEMKRSSEPANNTENNESNGNNSEVKTETPEIDENEIEEKLETTPVSPKMRRILEKLDSDKATEKLNAIMDISWENYHGATPKLLEIIQSEKDKYLRVFAIITLVSFREKDLLPVLKDIVFKEKESIVTETAEQAIVELEKFSR